MKAEQYLKKEMVPISNDEEKLNHMENKTKQNTLITIFLNMHVFFARTNMQMKNTAFILKF